MEYYQIVYPADLVIFEDILFLSAVGDGQVRLMENARALLSLIRLSKVNFVIQQVLTAW